MNLAKISLSDFILFSVSDNFCFSRSTKSGFAFCTNFSLASFASTDFLTVNQIAEMVISQMGLTDVKYEYSGGSRGWKADVPFYRLDTSKIRSKGWRSKYDSRAAVLDAVDSMILDIKSNKIKVRR